MAITSEYTGGYELNNILPKAIYNSQTIITNVLQITQEDRKSIFSFYFLDGFRTNIKISYSISSDNNSFSLYEEVINVFTPGNYLIFYTNTDITGYIKFKIEITGSAKMEFNQLGVLKGVRTRSFILLEGQNGHRQYPCFENLTVKTPVKLVNVSSTLKLAALKGIILKNEIETYTNGSIPSVEYIGNFVLLCYRDTLTNYLMLKTGILNYDNTITWNAPVSVYSTALSVSSMKRTFAIKKIADTKFIIGFVCNGGNAFVVAGDVSNTTVTLGTVTSAGAVSSSNPFCNIFKLTNTKFVYCSINNSANYPQYRFITVDQNNGFTFGNNFCPISSTAISIQGCLVDEFSAQGILFATGISHSSGIYLFTNYISDQNNINSPANVAISTTSNTQSAFSLDQINTSRGLLSYTVDDSTHKLSCRFFNITTSTIALSDQATSGIDANACTAKIISPVKILHIFYYSTTSKLYYVISDITSTSIAWGIAAEINGSISDCIFSLGSVTANRYLIFCSNESTHSVRYRIYEDDRNLYIGIMNESAVAGANAEVKVISQICNKFTSLTPGDQLYIQPDGSLTNSINQYPACAAISDTEVFIKK